jgi:hypothetical protein
MTGRRNIVVPRRRFTGWAALYFGIFVALPILAICVGLDYLLYRAAKAGLVSCLSLFCLMD